MTATAANPTVLLSMQNGPPTNCRKADVCFVCIQCSIDFLPLVTITNPGPSVLCAQFYIELPQMTVALLNAAGTNYNLTTWHGTANLKTLAATDVCRMILDITLQDRPITLCKADFNLGKANIDSVGVQELICAKILKLGFKQIFHLIFLQLCPGYSDPPHATLDHIRQFLAGPNGQLVTSTVIKFYQHLMNTSCLFHARCDYPISICDIFIQKLDRHLLPSFCHHYPLYVNSH
jgi:hypothetical protein